MDIDIIKPSPEFLQGLTIDKVNRVYSGKPGCMCGCNGKYFTTGPMVKKVLNILQQDPRTMQMDGVLDDGIILFIPDRQVKTGERNYVVYLKLHSNILRTR